MTVGIFRTFVRNFRNIALDSSGIDDGHACMQHCFENSKVFWRNDAKIEIATYAVLPMGYIRAYMYLIHSVLLHVKLTVLERYLV